MLNKIYKLNKLDIKFLSILFFYWLSINTGSKYINFNEISEFNFKYYFNFLRSILPYLLFVYFIIKFKIYLSSIFNKDLFYICFYLYGVIQIIGLFFSVNYFYEHYWVICLFSILIFFQKIQEKKDSDLVNLIFLANIYITFVIFLLFISIAIKENFFSYNLLYHSKSFNYELAGEYFPRSSGVSRMALVLFFFFNALYFANIFKRKIQLLIISTNGLLIFIIFLLQSRAVILFYLISYLIINFAFTFNNFKQRLIFYLFTIIIPAVLFFSYPISKNYFIEKLDVKNENFYGEPLDKNNFMRNDFLLKENKSNFSENIASISNNRVEAWKYLLQVFLNGELNDQMKIKVLMQGYEPKEKYIDGYERYIFGLGPQADRYLMKLKKENKGLAKSSVGPFGAHASNIFIYSLICGGFLSFLIFIILNLFILVKILKIIKYHKEIDLFKNYILISSIFIIFFLLFRGLIENSYGVFGVDLILMISSYTVLSNNLSKIDE